MNFFTLNEDDSSTRLHINLDKVEAFEQNKSQIIIHYTGSRQGPMVVNYYTTDDADVEFERIMEATKS